MQAVMDRADRTGAAVMRLVQAAFHNRSLSLYASLGFDIREPLSCMQGRTRERSIPGCAVRSAQPADEAACNDLYRRVHGLDRGSELAQAIQQGTARVVDRGGRVTGYTTNLGFFGHSTGETNPDIQALHCGRVVGRPGCSCAFTKQRPAALVPGERPARRPANDTEEHRTL
jgi:hypothetical protein